MRKDLLTTLEALVLSAGAQIGESTNVEIFEAVQEVYPEANPSTIYLGLVRMTLKGFFATRTGEPQPDRGGRARKLYKVTAAGHEALAATEEVLGAMRQLRRSLAPRKVALA